MRFLATIFLLGLAFSPTTGGTLARAAILTPLVWFGFLEAEHAISLSLFYR